MLRLCIAAACLLASVPVYAQRARVEVEPLGLRTEMGPLFDHPTRQVSPAGDEEVRTLQQLSADFDDMPGLRISAVLPGGWTPYVQAAMGEGRHRFVSRAERRTTGGNQPPLVSETAYGGAARLTQMEIGAGKRLAFRPGWPTAELTLGAALLRVRISHVCRQPGWPQPCDSEYRRVGGHYDAPGLTGGVGLRQGLVRGIAVHVRAGYAVGRVDTRRHHVDLLPEYDEFEAPRSQRVTTTQLSAGVSVRL